jgi:tRNA (uracil-5-)-methyltransferase
MTTTEGLGQVRTLSDSEQELPASKRPRIEPIAEVAEAKHLKVLAPTKTATVVLSDTNKPGAKKEGKKKQSKRQKRKGHNLPEPCSPEDVLWKDIVSVLGQEAVDEAVEAGNDAESPFAIHDEVEVEVKMLGSNGA